MGSQGLAPSLPRATPPQVRLERHHNEERDKEWAMKDHLLGDMRLLRSPSLACTLPPCQRPTPC